MVAFAAVVAPRYLLSWDAPSTPAADRAKAVNDIRTTLLQGLAGVALLAGTFFTWRQLDVSRHGQITQRFTAAVDPLGNTGPEVRIGAIFATDFASSRGCGSLDRPKLKLSPRSLPSTPP
ncbi:hypothetical protein [Streptomyces canus]|uniref:hypothetical protein n=1 Tax=Streptomyces canus TaxID=58343 RepID=UPI0027D82ECF|nr:hypothetical protein [Streptomyces canus]